MPMINTDIKYQFLEKMLKKSASADINQSFVTMNLKICQF